MAFYYETLFSQLYAIIYLKEELMASNQLKYISDYNKEKYYSVLLRIPKKDGDIIEKITSVPSKNGYVLNLIKEDIRPSVLKLGEIKKILKSVLGSHGITKIYLFGSYARGDATSNSDVDILCDKGNVKTLIEQGELEDELENKLGKKVDLVFTTSYMPDYFRQQIEKDLIELC